MYARKALLEVLELIKANIDPSSSSSSTCDNPCSGDDVPDGHENKALYSAMYAQATELLITKVMIPLEEGGNAVIDLVKNNAYLSQADREVRRSGKGSTCVDVGGGSLSQANLHWVMHG